jgi:TonB-dependent starch-binding outer membrane protein SusC
MNLLRLLRSMTIASLLLLFSLTVFSQSFPVSGKITNANGEPLAGVTIKVKENNIQVVTDAQGNFQINAPSPTSTLVITYVGFSEQEISLNNKSQLTLAMSPLDSSLESVVVIGYGTQKRKNVTGAVSSFDAKNVDERPLLRLDQAMVGQLAGVRVKQTTGTPGKGFSVQIRGSGSISGGNEPLYVIDGFPLSVNSSNTANGSFSTGSPLDNINPNDIESIQVLKDAAAAAIYGSRASNGVVIITTKHGKTGKPKISFNVYGGYNETAKKLEMMNGQQWIDQATEVINATYLNATYLKQFPTANASDDYATRRHVMAELLMLIIFLTHAGLRQDIPVWPL